MSKIHTLRDAYRQPGFVPAHTVHIDAHAPEVYVVALRRRQKKHAVVSAAPSLVALMTTSRGGLAISTAVVTRCFSNSSSAVYLARGAV